MLDYQYGLYIWLVKDGSYFCYKKHLIFSFLSTKTRNNVRNKLTPSFMTVYLMEILKIDTDWSLSTDFQ